MISADDFTHIQGEWLRDWALLIGCDAAPGETDEALRERIATKLNPAYLIRSDFDERNDRFPHVCPRCGGKAYIGFMNVDCQKGCA
jgi:hypothetical protein